MSELVVTVDCSLPGFEDVRVAYNLMATEAELDEFVTNMGRKGSHKAIVSEIQGWPEQYGEPLGEKTPIAFFAWMSRKGYALALSDFINDPSF